MSTSDHPAHELESVRNRLNVVTQETRFALLQDILGLPYTFYGISDSGRQFLKEHKLLRAQDTLREIYDRIEKTDDIIRYETATRPEN
jgi:hypothetical protein